jgi:streptomycin 6-kinase
MATHRPDPASVEPLLVPQRVDSNARRSPEGSAWLERLPETIRELEERWALHLGPPFDGPEVSASWVAPVTRVGGGAAVLKIPLPHMEADNEADGLRFWDGDPTVLLLEADERSNAMLLERCEPGTWLRELPEPEQDVVVATLLRRMWRVPPSPNPFRPLSTMLAAWSAETLVDQERWPDAGLVREGLRLFEELSRGDPGTHVLLATDLHAGNVLRSTREPWLVIDAMPFVGDPSYDPTQHLLNCKARLRDDGLGMIARLAELAGVDRERLHLWTFARVAAERDVWDNDAMDLARALAP